LKNNDFNPRVVAKFPWNKTSLYFRKGEGA
jgi:hypothetical protein